METWIYTNYNIKDKSSQREAKREKEQQVLTLFKKEGEELFKNQETSQREI